MLNIVLHEPEIPANTGNIGRTCVATNTRLHLIEPLGFRLNEKALKRAGMDYWADLDVRTYINFEDFLEKNPGAKIYMATTKAPKVYTEVQYEPDCYIMFGKESAGIPEEILVNHKEDCVRIPMVGDIRSLNLGNSVAIILYEALRQDVYKRQPQVKFVDRTFNCKHSHSMAIWTYLKEHDRGKTNFHFEVAADLLNEEEMELIASMRPGLIQLEIGIQSTNPETITEIRRKMNFEEVKRIVKRVQEKGNVHQHLDLIAGLPYEDYERFAQSFRDVYALHPEQLQLGFLKVLKGSYMHEKTEDYQLLYQDRPPFEVLSTKWLSRCV